MHDRLFGKARTYPVFLGKGCNHNCSFCGGGSIAQRIANNRREIALRSPRKVVDSIRDLERSGFSNIMFNYDPLTLTNAEKYYFEIFDLLSENPTSLNV